jgi:hypothetical protein
LTWKFFSLIKINDEFNGAFKKLVEIVPLSPEHHGERAFIMLKITISIFFYIGCLVSPSIAQQIDLRIRSDHTGDQYEVGFCGRPSPPGEKIPHTLPGHAFVMFSHWSTSGKRTFLSIGHTISPGTSRVEAAWSFFGSPVSGYLSEERYTSVRQKCLTAKVNKREYDMAYSLTKSPLEKLGLYLKGSPVLEAYTLGANDCLSFIIDVAKTLQAAGLSLKVPGREKTELPLTYIQRLIDMNS